MDYYFIVNHSLSTDRYEAYSTLCRLGMKRFVEATMYVLQSLLLLDDDYLLCAPLEKYGLRFLNIVIEGGTFGHYNEVNWHGKETRIKTGLRNLRHNLSIIKDYPSEVLWFPFWKIWHYCWRKINGYL